MIDIPYGFKYMNRMGDEKIKHLEFIQSVISRMSQNSFAIKGWAITLVSAILVVTHEFKDFRFVLIALLPAIVFWSLELRIRCWHKKS